MKLHKQKGILSKNEHDLFKKMRNNEEITIKKADKSNTVVIMNTCDYQNKIQDILNDSTKFKILKKDPTEKLKAKVNSLIETLRTTIEPSKPLPKQTGHFTPAYMYGNPKNA